MIKFQVRDCISNCTLFEVTLEEGIESTKNNKFVFLENFQLYSDTYKCTCMPSAVMIILLCRSPDLIIEVAHPCVTTEHGAYFLQHADYMVCVRVCISINHVCALACACVCVCPSVCVCIYVKFYHIYEAFIILTLHHRYTNWSY